MARLIIPILVTIVAAWSQSTERVANVSFLVVYVSGKAIPGWKVSSFKSGRRDATSLFTGLTGKQIPMGFYKYELTAPSVKTAAGADWTPTLSGEAQVLRSEIFVVTTATNDVLTGGSFDVGAPPTFVIRGKVEPMPPVSEDSDPVRINIHRILPHWEEVDVKVDPNGDFRIYVPVGGLCTLSVIRGSEILHVEPVFFGQGFRSSSLVVRIGQKPLSVMQVK
jgi:hypothetical protein